MLDTDENAGSASDIAFFGGDSGDSGDNALRAAEICDFLHSSSVTTVQNPVVTGGDKHRTAFDFVTTVTTPKLSSGDGHDHQKLAVNSSFWGGCHHRHHRHHHFLDDLIGNAGMVSQSLLQWSAERPVSTGQEEPFEGTDTRTDHVLNILAEVDALGMSVVLRDDRPVLLRRGLAPPSDIVNRLRDHRDAVAAYLRVHAAEAVRAQTMPEWQPPTPTTLETPERRPALPWVVLGDTKELPARCEPGDKPVPSGASCYCCRGRSWWRRVDDAAAWLCRTCHPPVPGVAIIEQSTKE